MTQENIKLDDYYKTSDLALAAVISIWFPIVVIDRTDPHKAEFLFKREEGLEDVVESFWKRELKIDALGYFNQLKALKARLYERE
ncbi:MAG: hypothetical protein ACD_13C00134G0043 [uncultured bacterium]|uniref:DUF5659 domain-containing protein n=1 Tax=Candidatus Woesebacteria bacterium GW2011_GWA1_40_43 TaxID=1618553 RepID=A0A0G0VMM7_9BACT|nr:MAG: hypothetical protein ACD_13C00134G0043 [uncultured bacterium]KKR52177.1 MAG: hypothetical protein UT88_C0024G0012 [Candidatus Woesebacteria bacterium GW2011_GWD2_40_19]KKR57622.1 MAG: hypothetical protein UT96_C0016G0007 [Candidatus Woesebacteria bacterium GW2011_GWC2_40_30]KKR64047.1 MAG: hypothetical protein UU02_C0013G0005 [Candidatus Woesebacteria bacterium GW2011_GWA1_40_43]HAU65459.1 hypothetical protein [Candidatus Woesebacteria bacterium]